MKSTTLALISFLIIGICQAFPEERSSRQRRDLTCAAVGKNGCMYSCKARGWATGTCIWNTETGAYNCECDQERRGIRCNLGGDNTCHYSCLAIGYANGMCDQNDNCKCGGGNNRWGEVIENVRDRL